MFKSLQTLRWPFIGGAASIYLLCFGYTISHPAFNAGEAEVDALIIGTLLCVVLYAVMRAVSSRTAQGS